MSIPLLSVALSGEGDVVTARQRARQLAELVGFDPQDQVRIATAVSEIARNAFQYAGGGRVSFAIEGREVPQLFLVTIADQGPGIPALTDVLAGRYESPTGMGLGIRGSRRLMDRFTIEAKADHGTTVTMGKLLSPHRPLVRPEQAATLARELATATPRTALDEVQQQNRELLRTLDELRRRHEELTRLNSELEDTNRGVVALYAELDERADHLRRADEMKSRFLSNMSHEFRTPLNSTLALTRLLLDRTDGPLTTEQELQVNLVRKAAQDLSDLVNDLLDLAKVEAGKVIVRPADFEVVSLFGALRGMLRPLLVGDAVSLVFEDAEGIPTLHTDEAKVSQILRNFISNALKYTESGEVRVGVRYDEDAGLVTFSVADTGIGIAPEDQERIFQEFSQVDTPLQRKVKGTGLGLPLSRRLAELLGGRLEVTSSPGQGSTFSAVLPITYATAIVGAIAPESGFAADPGRLPVLIVENDPNTLLVYDRYLRESAFQALPAHSLREARQWLSTTTPVCIVLDIMFGGEDAWKFLAELKTQDQTSGIPVIVVSTVDDPRKGLALGASDYAVKPVDRTWLLRRIAELTSPEAAPRVLVIDDDDGARYVLGHHLKAESCAVIEAGDGAEGLRIAIEQQPALIVLDLIMPGLSGFDVLKLLRSTPRTKAIPIIVSTSKALAAVERLEIEGFNASVFPKDALARDGGGAALRRALTEAGLHVA